MDHLQQRRQDLQWVSRMSWALTFLGSSSGHVYELLSEQAEARVQQQLQGLGAAAAAPADGAVGRKPGAAARASSSNVISTEHCLHLLCYGFVRSG